MSTELTELAVGTSVRVNVPATSANLGPGYDSFGLGLDLTDTLTFTVLESGFRAEVHGEGASYLPKDERHLVLATARDYLAERGYTAPGLELIAHNRIPHSRGMGSSAAALVGAAAGADALLPEHARGGADAVFQFASKLEGHPDNVAPAVYGGLTISWTEQPELFGAVTTQPLDSVIPVLFVPSFSLATSTARKVLPQSIDHAEAAENSARAGLLVYALTQDPTVLLTATEDRLHQRYRAETMPNSYGLMAQLRAAGHAAVISGAGPAVLCFARSAAEAEQVAAFPERVFGADAGQWRVGIHGVSTEGVRVEEHRQ
ncbi:homoserine kinase [Micrococcoides hystricis]|uniref:Homoserine kinase n=1 Tax=Micrococcoides hystricis TaxID=1572761 RepID=A0ABV6PBU9_9MICC